MQDARPKSGSSETLQARPAGRHGWDGADGSVYSPSEHPLCFLTNYCLLSLI